LRQQGIDVRIPALPDADAPRLDAWLDTLDAASIGIDDDLLVIGHSLGAVAALHWISRRPQPARIAGLLLVAPPLQATGIPEVDRFLSPAPDLAAARRRVERAGVFVSDVDRYLLPDPWSVAQRLAAHGFDVTCLPGRGHFAPGSGLTELPEILSWSAGLTVSTA
jgi:predicted alpha/beta hydrolase family esterase